MFIHGTRGPAVEQLQTQLLALGYPLPRWGADGDLGNETLGAVAHFLADHAGGYVDADPESVSDEERALVQRVYDQTAWPAPVPGKVFYDLRRESDSRHIIGRRRWTDIIGITLHQTACDFGAETANRWDTLAAHGGVSREGNVYHVHEFFHKVPHGNELNDSEVGWELEGLYPGLVRLRDRTRPQSPTLALIKAAHEAIRYTCAVVAAHGGKVLYLHAHRQTAQTRRGDPGEEIWRLVALPIMAELGLTDGGSQFKIDNGRVIPEEWNPAYVGNAY